MTINLQVKQTKESLSAIPQGAHITSWKNSQGEEQLFLSEQAIFAPGAAIRGGVPLIFPQFGAFGSGQKHGFARTANWASEAIRENTCAVFNLNSDSDSLKIWPYKFAAEFIAAIGDDELSMTLRIVNEGEDAMEFTAALHTYFLISDIGNISISGLDNCSYWDNGTPLEQRQTMDAEKLNIDGPIDRVYFSTQRPIVLEDQNSLRTITAQGFSDSVVWNPGIPGAKDLKDMADDEYKKMICIESAAIDNPVVLQAGQSWAGIQKIKFAAK